MNRRTLAIVVAAVLAIGAGLLMFDYLLSVNKTPQSPMRSVLVASKDIAARSTIDASNVQVVQRPVNTVDPNALGKISDIKPGSVAFVSIPEGSTITGTLIGPPTAQALPVHLRAGMRAIAIQVDVVKAIAGLVQPGDYVDVISSPPRDARGQPKAYAILRKVRVLAVGSSIETIGSATPNPSLNQDPRTITLEVSPTQADLLTMADINSTLRLALYSPQDHTPTLPPENLVFAESLPAGGGGAPAPADNNGKGGAQGAPTHPRISPVTVIDGDQVQ